MTATSNLQKQSVRRLLMWCACMAVPVAQALGEQPPALNTITSASTSQSTWIATGNLNVARSGHTATLLNNGKVLVVGGHTVDICCAPQGLGTAELFDPASGTWTLTGGIKVPRSGHTATLLSNGAVLVAGGTAGQTAELYDPITGTWSPTGSMRVPRSDHTATSLADGKVLVAGGTDNEGRGIASAELYDPDTGLWAFTGALSVPRYHHAATMLRDGKVLVLGGWMYDEDFPSIFSSTELYDPVNRTWTYAGGLNVPRVNHTATLVSSGKVLVTGGLRITYPGGVTLPESLPTVELFDPATGTSTRIGDLILAREDATATLMTNDEVMVVGGMLRHSTKNYTTNYISDVTNGETYDSKRMQWQSVGELLTPRHDHTATLLQDGRLLVAGGTHFETSSSATALASAEIYGNLPAGTIGQGYTGSWFDPAQSGHGLFVEVLPDNQLLVAWFTFNPAGTAQSWFLGVGTYSGNTATVTSVVQPTGGRWIPNFDPSRVVNNTWGTLALTFTDCNHGKVDFSSTFGYGTGSMNLTRLTQPAGLACQ